MIIKFIKYFSGFIFLVIIAFLIFNNYSQKEDKHNLNDFVNDGELHI